MKENATSDGVIVRGDVQLRNVCVHDARETLFVDDAHYGPNHPCFDLVRFERQTSFLTVVW